MHCIYNHLHCKWLYMHCKSNSLHCVCYFWELVLKIKVKILPDTLVEGK